MGMSNFPRENVKLIEKTFNFIQNFSTFLFKDIRTVSIFNLGCFFLKSFLIFKKDILCVLA